MNRPQAAETSVVEAVAKYFFFVSLDPDISFTASLKVLNELKRRNHTDAIHRSEWIATLHRWRTKVHRLRAKAAPVENGFELPADFDLAVWVSFLASGRPEEVEAVLLSRILAFSDSEIAGGLDVTEGTVRYRVGRGLRHLGGYNES